MDRYMHNYIFDCHIDERFSAPPPQNGNCSNCIISCFDVDVALFV